MSRDVRAGPTECRTATPPSAQRPGPQPKMMIPLRKPKDEWGATNPVLLSNVQTADVPFPPTPNSQSAYGSHKRTRSQGNFQNTLFFLATIFVSRSSRTAQYQQKQVSGRKLGCVTLTYMQACYHLHHKVGRSKTWRHDCVLDYFTVPWGY
jgi:hypothetical protein